MVNYFKEEDEAAWDGCIYMKSVKGDLGWRELTKPLLCGDGYIDPPFRWNGASSGIFQYLLIFNFPKWKHPIASCRHDFRCSIAKNKEERKLADELFRKDVGIGGTKWEQVKGYAGVRIGAFFGIGVNYK